MLMSYEASGLSVTRVIYLWYDYDNLALDLLDLQSQTPLLSDGGYDNDYEPLRGVILHVLFAFLSMVSRTVPGKKEANSRCLLNGGCLLMTSLGCCYDFSSMNFPNKYRTNESPEKIKVLFNFPSSLTGLEVKRRADFVFVSSPRALFESWWIAESSKTLLPF